MRKAGLLRDNLDLYAPEIIRNEFGEQTTVFNKVYSCKINYHDKTIAYGDWLIKSSKITE